MKKLTFFVGMVLLLQLQSIQAQTISEGLKFFENENFTAALNTFKTLATQEPTNPIHQYYIGEVLYATEDYAGAEKAYLEGIKINSKSPESNIGLAKIKLDQGKAPEAQLIFDAVVKANKKSAAALGLIGHTLLNSKKPNATKALEYLIKSRDMDPKVAITWSDMGDAYKLNQDLGNAMTSYESAVEKDKNNLKALMNMAEMWAASKQVDLAIKKLEDAMALSPDYAPAYKSLYELYIRARKFSKVTPLLDKYVSLVGTDVDARVRLVKFLCFQAKDYDRAISEGTKVLASNPEQYTLHRWLAWAHYEKENFQDSYDHSKKLFAAAEKEPTRKLFPSDYEYYAKATYKIGNLDEAAIAYERVLQDEPNKAHDYYGNLAKSYFETKNYEKALTYYGKKGEVKALNIADLYYTGLSQFYSNRFVEADSSFSMVLAANPNYPQGWWMKVRIAKTLDTTTVNRTWLARPMFEKYIEYASTAFTSDPEKNKSYRTNLLEAYNYLSYCYVQLGDFELAKLYYNKLLELDPTNTTAADNLKILTNMPPPKKTN